ncbi:MAG: ABC transporter permease [Gammaproteobacteria bacterium]
MSQWVSKMFAYHLRLALQSLRKSPILTALVVGLIALGVGMSMVTLTIHSAMSGDPIPAKSDVLFNVQIDSWSDENPWDEDKPDAAPPQLTHIDAMAIRELPGVKRRAAMFKAVYTVVPDDPELKPFFAGARMTDSDFFDMFQVPFVYGGGWSASVDQQAERVVVLTHRINEKFFGGENSVGKTIALGTERFKVVGVIDHWEPTPTFYDLNNGFFDDTQDVFLPFSMLQFGQLDRAGNTNCWGPGDNTKWEDFLLSTCNWIQLWVEFDSASDVPAFQRELDAYANGQKELGRLPRDLNNPLMNVNDWLAHNEVVGEDNTVLVGLSFLFLAVCLFNAVGILLARFQGKAGVIGVRRALGASKGAIFRQHLVEVAMIGVFGGLVGLALSWLGLYAVRKLMRGYEHLVHLDMSLVLTAVGIAVISAVLAGLYPTWRVCQVTPASYLKTQ